MAYKNPADRTTYNTNYYQDNRAVAIEKAAAYREENREAIRLYFREYRKANKDKLREQDWIRKYGITAADYDAMLARQGGGCAICGGGPDSKTKGMLCVDHDHVTGVVRGLLCSRCNTAIGYMRDDVDLLKRAAEYLTKCEK